MEPELAQLSRLPKNQHIHEVDDFFGSNRTENTYSEPRGEVNEVVGLHRCHHQQSVRYLERLPEPEKYNK